METVKPFLELEQQIEKLQSRGCAVEDKNAAIGILSRVNYYRLSAYFLPL
jgi:abortive infection bacteriophage resistance protein